MIKMSDHFARRSISTIIAKWRATKITAITVHSADQNDMHFSVIQNLGRPSPRTRNTRIAIDVPREGERRWKRIKKMPKWDFSSNSCVVTY